MRWPSRVVCTSALAAAVLLGACSPTDDLRGPTAVAKPTEPARPTIAVRRGTIDETVKGVGRVTSASETTLFFRTAGRIRQINIETRQPVKKGDVIAELETGQLGVQVEVARVNLQIAELRAAQSGETSGSTSVKVAASSVAKAESDLAAARATQARAVADLARAQATAGGTVNAPVKAYEAARASARARLALVQAGPQPADLAATDQAVVTAQAAVGKAETDLDKTRRGYTPEEIRAAEFQLEAAKNAVYAAQVVRDAARGRADGSGAAAGDAQIATAQANVDAAADRLKSMRAGGKNEDIAVAQKNVDSARAVLAAAQSRADALRAGPRPEEVAVATSAVDEAQARLDASRAEIAGAPAAIEAGTAAVEAAKAAVEAAGKNAEVARATYDQRVAEVKAAGGKGAELAVAEKQLEIARLNLRALEQQVEETRVRAPFDGVVRELVVKTGDQVQAYGSIGALADPAKLELTLDVPASDASKVTLGQDATVSLDGGATSFPAKVIGLPTGPTVAGATTANGDTRPIRLSLVPDVPGANLGAGAAIAIVTRRRENALIVPAAAIKKFGGRSLVQVVGPDGRRRDVEVETGIATDADVEIRDGLSEGQAVAAS